VTEKRSIVMSTLLMAAFTGMAIWLVAGPPPPSPKPFNPHQFIISVK
jgi:hypothetical protein